MDVAPPLQKSEPTLIQYCVASDKILELKPPENEIIANLEPITVVKKCSKSLLKLKENSVLVTQDSFLGSNQFLFLLSCFNIAMQNKSLLCNQRWTPLYCGTLLIWLCSQKSPKFIFFGTQKWLNFTMRYQAHFSSENSDYEWRKYILGSTEY